MKTRKPSSRFGKTQLANHIVKEQKKIAEERIQEIHSTLRMHYAGLERLYAFASGEKTLKKSWYTQRARAFQRTFEDEQRLQWTASNLQGQITQLQQELSQLIRGLL